MSGTRCINGGLTPSEVCAILKACGEAKVAELKFGTLHVRFATPATPVSEPEGWIATPGYADNMGKAPAPQPAAEIAEIQTEEAERALLRDEISLRQDQLADLWISDPARAEEMLVNGELSDDGEPDEEA